jgi:hypothetical protein
MRILQKPPFSIGYEGFTRARKAGKKGKTR